MTITVQDTDGFDGLATDTVLFDMDGVILEGRGSDSVIHSRALDDVLFDREIDVPENLRTALETYEYDDPFVAACKDLGVDPDEFYADREQRSAMRSIERLAAGVRRVYDDVDAISRIADHATVGLVSNNYNPTVEFVVDHFRLTEFEFVRGRDLGPDGFRRRKPNPHYLNEALNALDATDGLYVGDRETDVIAAERAGLDSALIRREHNASLDLEVEPTIEIRSLRELFSLIEQ